MERGTFALTNRQELFSIHAPVALPTDNQILVVSGDSFIYQDYPTGGNPFDQDLNTFDSPTFAAITTNIINSSDMKMKSISGNLNNTLKFRSDGISNYGAFYPRNEVADTYPDLYLYEPTETRDGKVTSVHTRGRLVIEDRPANGDSGQFSFKRGAFSVVCVAETLTADRVIVFPNYSGKVSITNNPAVFTTLGADSLTLDNGGNATITAPVLSGDISLQLPATSGTLALTTDTPADVLTDTLDTDIGNNNIVVGTGVGKVVKDSGFTTDQSLAMSSDVSFNSVAAFTFLSANTSVAAPAVIGSLTVNTPQLQLKNSGFVSTLNSNTLSSDLAFTMPASAGTLALTSQIPTNATMLAYTPLGDWSRFGSTPTTAQIAFDNLAQYCLSSAANANLAAGYYFSINSGLVLSSTTLGSGVINSSITSNTAATFTNTGIINTTSKYQIGAVDVLTSTTLSSAIANANITSNTAATFTNTGIINTTSKYQIGAVDVLTSTTLGSAIVNSSITSNTAATFTNTGIINSTSKYQIGAVDVLTSTTLSSAIANANITSNTAGTFTNSGNVNVTSGTYQIGASAKLSSTQLNNQNTFPASSGTLAIIGAQNYIWEQTTATIATTTTGVTTGNTVMALYDQANAYQSISNNFSPILSGTKVIGLTNNGGPGIYKITVRLSAQAVVGQFVYFMLYQNVSFKSLMAASVPTTVSSFISYDIILSLANADQINFWFKVSTTTSDISLYGGSVSAVLVGSLNA